MPDTVWNIVYILYVSYEIAVDLTNNLIVIIECEFVDLWVEFCMNYEIFVEWKHLHYLDESGGRGWHEGDKGAHKVNS